MLLDIKESFLDSKPLRRMMSTSWIPPPGLALKFNVNESVRGNPGKAGIGGVLRDSSGKILGLFSEFVVIFDPISTEILAIPRAVNLCVNTSDLVGKEIVFVSGSKTAVTWINSDGFKSLAHANIILDIRNLLMSLDNSSIIFNPRDSNSLANSLAKKGVVQERNDLVWEFP